MKKFFILPLLLATLFNNNLFAADKTNSICKVTKTQTITANNKKNLVGLDYEIFNVKHESSRKNAENDLKTFTSDDDFFIFKEPYKNLTPKYLNGDNFKKGCINAFNEWKNLPSEDVHSYEDSSTTEPIFISKNKKYLITTVNSYMYAGGAHGMGSMEYRYYDTETQTKLDTEKLLADAFKDKNYAENPQLVEMIKNKIKADKEYFSCLFSKGENLYLPSNIGIRKNQQTKQNNLFAYYSIYEIAPYVCGPYEISFTPREINHFLNTNSILYKLLNDEI